MKVLMQPVEMIAWFTKEGIPHPVKFKISLNDEPAEVIKIANTIFRTEEKLAGNKMMVFRCQGLINGLLKIFELKYELNTCKWYLYKI